MHARVSTYQSPAETLAESEERDRAGIVPEVRRMKGNRGVISLIDRQTGRSMSITLWEDEEALRATEEVASRIRTESTNAAGGQIRGVERFEVSIFDVD